MEKVLPEVKNLLKSESKAVSIAIIAGEREIVYSTENWDISNDIDIINSIWDSNKPGNITISGETYVILQISDEKLIATSPIKEGGIFGFRDDERKIICKTTSSDSMKLGLVAASKALRNLSSKKPYLDSNIQIEKKEEITDLTPKIISETSRVLEKLGFYRVGLSEDDAKVYLALLRKGEMGEKVSNLDKELDLKRTHIYRIIDRLIEKDWVDKLSRTPTGAQYYIARPPKELLDNLIKEKKEEIKILEGLKLLISDDIKNGWKIISDLEKEQKSHFDLDIHEIIGSEKDFGIMIYEYDRIIKGEENLDKVKLRIYSKKLETIINERKEIGKLKDLADVKINEIEIQDYVGSEIYIKFKNGTKTANSLGDDWIIVAKLVSIPIDNKIYIIWGSEGKFEILMDMFFKIGF